MIWLYPVGDTFTVFYVKPNLEGLIELDSLPESSGILRRAEDGTFYYEPYPEEINPPIIEQPTEPPTEIQPPVLSVEEMQAQILLNTEYLVSRAELGL
ncbi:hypothetical protein [Lysinibacillus sp.]|uniref:hypothetical protein n=1 Tax=Lysinibacillus sp. TaxID=1869345 RepID=UPI0028A20514|nr:hypothetical protein [Lysinibacillus sp.]